jgi:hypothetical protein
MRSAGAVIAAVSSLSAISLAPLFSRRHVGMQDFVIHVMEGRAGSRPPLRPAAKEMEQ